MRCNAHTAEGKTPVLLVPADPQTITGQINALREKLLRHRRFDLGFPGASDVHHDELAELLTRCLLNNIGDPFEDGTVTHHTKGFERQVLAAVAWLFRAPPGDWWGYVTTGSSEGTLHALRTARAAYPNGIVLHSVAAHYSVTKAADLLALPTAAVAADERGEMDYGDLAVKLVQHRHRRPIIVATIGTTMTEAVDDLHRINAVCDQLKIRERYLHADAALSGIPLALLPSHRRPGFDLADGADSIVCSGHKFLSTLMPCAVLIMKRHTTAGELPRVDYIGGHDTTITGSRSGHLPLLLWAVIGRYGLAGLRARAEQARQTAAYAQQRLAAIGWPAWRHEHAFTVVLRTPPAHVIARWPLPSSNGWSHLITMPGVSRNQVDQFVRHLAASHYRQDDHDQPLLYPVRRPVIDAKMRW